MPGTFNAREIVSPALALKEYQPLKYKENIEVVKKFAKQIDEALK